MIVESLYYRNQTCKINYFDKFEYKFKFNIEITLFNTIFIKYVG